MSRVMSSNCVPDVRLRQQRTRLQAPTESRPSQYHKTILYRYYKVDDVVYCRKYRNPAYGGAVLTSGNVRHDRSGQEMRPHQLGRTHGWSKYGLRLRKVLPDAWNLRYPLQSSGISHLIAVCDAEEAKAVVRLKRAYSVPCVTSNAVTRTNCHHQQPQLAGIMA